MNYQSFDELWADLSNQPEPSSRERLKHFCEQVETGQTPDSEFLQELAGAFRQLIEAPTIKAGLPAFTAAMGLKGKGGRKPGSPNKYNAALKVFLLDPDGANRAKVVGDVAEEYGVDDSTIRRYVRENKAQMELFGRDLLRILNEHPEP